MVHPISVATRLASVIGWSNTARPNNGLAAPIITSITVFTVGTVATLYKCTTDIILDAKERIEYYHERKSEEE